MKHHQVVAAGLMGLMVAATVVVAVPSTTQAASKYYVARKCSVTSDGKARLSVTRWYDTTKRRWVYHYDMNSRNSLKYGNVKAHSVSFDGKVRSGTNDLYSYRSSSDHIIYATWTVRDSWHKAKCSIRI